MRRVPPLAVSAAISLSLAACGGDDDGDAAPAGAQRTGGCEEVSQPEPKDVDLARPEERLRKGAEVTAVVETTCGRFEIALDTERAPRTSSSFAHLVDEALYEDTTIHRILVGAIIQGGDPSGDGTGGPGYFVDEPPPQNLAYTRGTVAMAKTQVEPAGRSGSQFFVVTAPADAGLPPDYALLGEVTKGMGVVERIERLGDPADLPEGGAPSMPVVIERITLERR